MPNHYTNVLRITAYKHEKAPAGLVAEILDAIKGLDTAIDFERIVPMPPELRITSGSVTNNAQALYDARAAETIMGYPWACEKALTTLTALRAYLREQYLQHPEEGFATLDDYAARVRSNIEKHGAVCWYEWAVQHWGTKWNAYTVTGGMTGDNEAVLHFETAWAPPLPVIDALAARYPQAYFSLIGVDEGDTTAARLYWSAGKRDAD